MTRRVYEMDNHLLARVSRFRAKFGSSSEVEAVRRLLTTGLDCLETEDELIARLKERGDARELSAHPHVAQLTQKDGDLTSFTLKSGRVFKVSRGSEALDVWEDS